MLTSPLILVGISNATRAIAVTDNTNIAILIQTFFPSYFYYTIFKKSKQYLVIHYGKTSLKATIPTIAITPIIPTITRTIKNGGSALDI